MRSSRILSLDTGGIVAVCGLLILTSSVNCELTAEYITHTPRRLLLTCSMRDLPPGSDVISIRIDNDTTFAAASSRVATGGGVAGAGLGAVAGGGGAGRAGTGGGVGDTLAWLAASDGVPKFGNGSGRAGDSFVSGRLTKADTIGSRLQLLLMNHEVPHRTAYICVVTMLGHKATLKHITYRTVVDVPSLEDNVQQPDRAPTPAPKLTTRNPTDQGHEAPVVRTGSVLQPTVLEAGVPMSVLIIMLVLITLLLVITAALLLQKFRGRCGSPPMPYTPPHYAMAGEAGLGFWEGLKGGVGGGVPSPHSVVGLRSHYSLPRPLQPPPPPPKLHRSKSRESGDYATGGSCGGGGMGGGGGGGMMTRSFHYTTPYDAIAHDEDGELSLLNTSAHCDITPSLPPELLAGGEPTYKVPRSEAEVQTQGQGHSMYAASGGGGGLGGMPMTSASRGDVSPPAFDLGD